MMLRMRVLTCNCQLPRGQGRASPQVGHLLFSSRQVSISAFSKVHPHGAVTGSTKRSSEIGHSRSFSSTTTAAGGGGTGAAAGAAAKRARRALRAVSATGSTTSVDELPWSRGQLGAKWPSALHLSQVPHVSRFHFSSILPSRPATSGVPLGAKTRYPDDFAGRFLEPLGARAPFRLRLRSLSVAMLELMDGAGARRDLAPVAVAAIRRRQARREEEHSHSQCSPRSTSRSSPASSSSS